MTAGTMAPPPCGLPWASRLSIDLDGADRPAGVTCQATVLTVAYSLEDVLMTTHLDTW